MILLWAAVLLGGWLKARREWGSQRGVLWKPLFEWGPDRAAHRRGTKYERAEDGERSKEAAPAPALADDEKEVSRHSPLALLLPSPSASSVTSASFVPPVVAVPDPNTSKTQSTPVDAAAAAASAAHLLV